VASTEWIVFSSEEVVPRFLRQLLVSDFFHVSFMQTITGVGGSLSRANPAAVGEIKIPLPPLEVQNEIVAEIQGCQQVINGASSVLDNYRPHIPIHPDWPMVKLGEVIESKPKNGYSGSPVDRPTSLKVLSLSATTSGKMDLSKFKFLDEDIPLDSSCRCRRGDIFLQRGNTKELVGTAAIFDMDDENYIYPDLMIRVRADEAKIRSHYLLTVLQSASVREFITRNAVGAAGSMPKINQAIVESIPIPLPPLATQEAIVAEIEAEQALVAANRELVARFEQKIQATLARIWGEEAPAVTEA
jgi:type I restriction enzyme M protein